MEMTLEVVPADNTVEVAALDIWDADGTEPLSGTNLEGVDHIEITKNGVRPVLSAGLANQEEQ